MAFRRTFEMSIPFGKYCWTAPLLGQSHQPLVLVQIQMASRHRQEDLEKRSSLRTTGFAGTTPYYNGIRVPRCLSRRRDPGTQSVSSLFREVSLRFRRASVLFDVNLVPVFTVGQNFASNFAIRPAQDRLDRSFIVRCET